MNSFRLREWSASLQDGLPVNVGLFDMVAEEHDVDINTLEPQRNHRRARVSCMLSACQVLTVRRTASDLLEERGAATVSKEVLWLMRVVWRMSPDR